jgi:hypothetical protein
MRMMVRFLKILQTSVWLGFNGREKVNIRVNWDTEELLDPVS